MNALSAAVFDGVPLEAEGDQEALFNEVDELAEEFDLALQNSMREAAKEHPDAQVVVDRWSEVGERLDIGSVDALFHDVGDVVEKLAKAIVDVGGFTLSNDTYTAVEIGVLNAYAALLRKFRDRISGSSAAEAMRDGGVDVVGNVDDALESLDTLERELRGRGGPGSVEIAGGLEFESVGGLGLEDAGTLEVDSERLMEAFDLERGSTDSHNDYAVLQARQGETKEAKEHFRKVLELDAGHVEAHSNIAVLLSREGNRKEALEHLEQALELDPGNAAANLNYANLLKETDPEEAEKYYEQALEYAEGVPEPLNDYAVYLAERGRGGEAEDLWREALEIDSRYLAALRNLGGYLVARERYGEAEILLERALDQEADAGVYHNYAVLLDRRGDDGAEEMFSRAIDAAPGYVDAYYGLASLLVREGRLTDVKIPNVGDVPDLDGLLDLLAQLVDVAEDEGIHELALEWCGRALSIVDDYDLDERKREFGIRYALLGARDPDGSTIELYGYALRYVMEEETEKAAYLFKEAWDRRYDVEDSMISGVALSAGVGFLAHLRVFGVDPREGYDDVLEELEENRGNLTFAASVLLDRVSGAGDVGPGYLLGRAEVSEEQPSMSLSQMELLAYARLLKGMERETTAER